MTQLIASDILVADGGLAGPVMALEGTFLPGCILTERAAAHFITHGY